MKIPVLSLCLVLFGTAFGLTGCTYLQELVGLGVQQPKVHLVDLTVSKATLSSIDVLVALRVDNPNSFDISFAKLRYKLTASGAQVASGTHDQHITVPSSGHAIVKLPLTIDGDSILRVLHDLLTKSNETYAVLQATADFDTPFGAMEAHFEDKKPLRQVAGF